MNNAYRNRLHFSLEKNPMVESEMELNLFARDQRPYNTISGRPIFHFKKQCISNRANFLSSFQDKQCTITKDNSCQIFLVEYVQVFSRDSHENGCFLEGDGFKTIDNYHSREL